MGRGNELLRRGKIASCFIFSFRRGSPEKTRRSSLGSNPATGGKPSRSPATRGPSGIVRHQSGQPCIDNGKRRNGRSSQSPKYQTGENRPGQCPVCRGVGQVFDARDDRGRQITDRSSFFGLHDRLQRLSRGSHRSRGTRSRGTRSFAGTTHSDGGSSSNQFSHPYPFSLSNADADPISHAHTFSNPYAVSHAHSFSNHHADSHTHSDPRGTPSNAHREGSEGDPKQVWHQTG